MLSINVYISTNVILSPNSGLFLLMHFKYLNPAIGEACVSSSLAAQTTHSHEIVLETSCGFLFVKIRVIGVSHRDCLENMQYKRKNCF